MLNPIKKIMPIQLSILSFVDGCQTLGVCLDVISQKLAMA